MRRLGTLRSRTGDPRLDAIAELRWCVAGEGLTADKLAVLPAVLGLPAVRAATEGVPVAGRPAVALGAVVAAARALGGSLDARLLRTALGIDYEGDARNLTERRAVFGWVGEPRTLYDRERKMLEALVTLLGAPPAGGGPRQAAGLAVTYRLAGRALRTVEADVPHDIRYDVEYAGGAPRPLCAVRVTSAVELLTVRVCFDPDDLPEVVWRVAGEDQPERLHVDPAYGTEAAFADPAVGRPYGIAWAWLSLEPQVSRWTSLPSLTSA